MNIFEKAARLKLRFQSVKGALTTEQLFDLPLTNSRDKGYDLDTVARSINGDLKALGEESFVGTTSNPNKAKLELAMEIVKFVIKSKQDDIASNQERAATASQITNIEALIAAKRGEELAAKPLSELEAELAALKAKA